MDDLIRLSRKAANEWRNNDAYYQASVLIDSLCDRLEDAVPVKQSFWESYETSAYGGYDEDGVRWLKRRFFRCERCRKGSAIKSNFCPNCGADMRDGRMVRDDGNH